MLSCVSIFLGFVWTPFVSSAYKALQSKLLMPKPTRIDTTLNKLPCFINKKKSLKNGNEATVNRALDGSTYPG
jgi:hypothetical protein